MEVKLVDGQRLLCESAAGAGDRELKRRRWGCRLPRCLAARRPRGCVPRCGTRALADRWLPVLDESAVGELGLVGELFVERVLLLCDPDADSLSLLALRAGHQLEPAQLLAGERPGEGVVLATAEHLPGDHGELTGDG